MTLIGTVRRTPPLFRETFAVSPDATFILEDIRSPADATWRVLCRVTASDFAALEDGLDADTMIHEYDLLTDLESYRLYRIDLSEKGGKNVPRTTTIEHDILILDLTITATSEQITARFPSRTALSEWRDHVTSHGYTFHLDRLYSEAPTPESRDSPNLYGMTDAQAEALYRAFEAGYFEVPRETELGTIADEMGISTNALSKRLRRGHRHLIYNTLAKNRVE